MTGGLRSKCGLAWERYVINRKIPQSVLKRGFRIGYCPTCPGRTVFVKRGNWLRDDLICVRCGSIPRWRAIIAVLEDLFPSWREMSIHESSPGGAASHRLALDCPGYLPTGYYPGQELGSVDTQELRNEDLENLTFDNDTFDLVVTQDVFEHVLHPRLAFAEIARTLKPGGCHVFTLPWYYWQKTKPRVAEENGEIVNLEEPSYHANPTVEGGSLVVTDWGYDLCDIIYESSGLSTTVVRLFDPGRGLQGAMLEVFVSRKPEVGAAAG